jgi:hypothetical protein
MKNLFISLALFTALAFIGCNENNVTDPVSTDLVNKNLSTNNDTYRHGVISLDRVLSDPSPVGNSFYRITGRIEFDHRTFFADPVHPAPQQHVSISFTTDAEFLYFCTVCPPSENDNLAGFISEVSEEFVQIGGNNVSNLERTFNIQGREDGMVLKTRFLVSTDGFELNAMWLALPNANMVATDINHY